MPEGPEIIITTQYLNTKIKKKKMEKIEIIGSEYQANKIVKGFELTKNTPLIIDIIDSKGKFMWFEMTDKNGKKIYMLNTLGLTGRWSFHADKNIRFKFVIKSNSNVNKRYDLYYIDNLKYGTIMFTDDVNVLMKKLNQLAPDVLKSNMTDDELVAAIKYFNAHSRKNKNLVKVFLNQTAIVSGIGNYLIAECLYDAKLNPHRNLNDLSNNEIKTLAHSIRKITKNAYYKNTTGYMKYFKIFMKTHSEKIDKNIFPNYDPDIKIKTPFEFKVYQQKTDPYGNIVKADMIVKDKRIYWVPKVQK